VRRSLCAAAIGFALAAALAGCGDSVMTNSKAITCQAEIGESTVTAAVGKFVGDSTTIDVRSERAMFYVVNIGGKKYLRTDILSGSSVDAGAATTKPPGTSIPLVPNSTAATSSATALPPGVIHRAQSLLDDTTVKAGSSIQSDSTAVSEGVLGWSCVWR
jgi:hypothetical protein